MCQVAERPSLVLQAEWQIRQADFSLIRTSLDYNKFAQPILWPPVRAQLGHLKPNNSIRPRENPRPFALIGLRRRA